MTGSSAGQETVYLLNKTAFRFFTTLKFVFKGVFAAKLEKENWAFSGRSETSRRTITASVTRSGAEKMKANWIYRENSNQVQT